ncbi:hypothetical protein AMECASPLE_027520 [Ameca splendens]|uniref:Immunoglobulin subtype domain-containing protein n=1 Tax=Ameca splendens TaxID=208324 RepID=A0ABV0Z3G0_9TELE
MAKSVTYLFHLFLVFALQIQGSTSVTHVFVQTRKDLILNVTEAEIPSESRLWVWQFNGASMVEFSSDSKPNVVSHAERTEVLENKYCVKLRNLQKSDMGIYTAKVLLSKEQKLTEYNVTVQDPVSPGNLTFNCMSSNTSSCILKVTCSVLDSSINSTVTCRNQTCNQEGGEPRGVTKFGTSLHIYQLNESIVCNHSNQVSSVKSIKKIGCCTQHGEPRHHYWSIVLLLPIIVCTTIICCRHKKGNKDNIDNTIYDLPVLKNQTEKLEETVEDEVLSPTTTYSVVSHKTEKSKETRGKNPPESMYAQITMPSR